MPKKKKTQRRKKIKKKEVKKLEDFKEVEVVGGEGENIGEGVKNLENRQLMWVLIVVVLVFVGFFAVYFYVQSLSRFDYAGVRWVKEDYGELKIYHARFPILYHGVLKNYYNMFLRNDPRENNIPVNIDELKFSREVVVSNSPEAGGCIGAMRITGDLSMFLSALPFVEKLSGAISDEKIANELNLSFADCSSAVNKTVVIIQTSDEPFIEQESRNCYVINIGQCDNVRAVERFMIEIVARLNNVKI